ncbi:MAG: hypothetical protein LBS99_02460 [Clostridiales bacterium]|jgi:hypothetical protein|nr:hypothetical protein [Clostridiales bacterium]
MDLIVNYLKKFGQGTKADFIKLIVGKLSDVLTIAQKERKVKYLTAPRSSRFKDAQVFTERYVKMRGNDYYMRVFYDGSSEFIRFDETAKKWVFVLFPAA